MAALGGPGNHYLNSDCTSDVHLIIPRAFVQFKILSHFIIF